MTELKEFMDLDDKKSFLDLIENYYQKFYTLPETKKEYENCAVELLACMQEDGYFD